MGIEIIEWSFFMHRTFFNNTMNVYKYINDVYTYIKDVYNYINDVYKYINDAYKYRITHIQ